MVDKSLASMIDSATSSSDADKVTTEMESKPVEEVKVNVNEEEYDSNAQKGDWKSVFTGIFKSNKAAAKLAAHNLGAMGDSLARQVVEENPMQSKQIPKNDDIQLFPSISMTPNILPTSIGEQ